MYVYRKINNNYALIPKGLYVKILEITYNPFGIKENSLEFSINIHSLRECATDTKCDIK
jgi:hypothetical protein